MFMIGCICIRASSKLQCWIPQPDGLRLDPEWRRDYQRLQFRRGGAVAKGSPVTPVVGEACRLID
jgi:hypothetical protein